MSAMVSASLTRTPAPERPANARRILVADDDDAFRATLHDVLVDAGYDVVAVPSGRTALEHLRTARPRPHLLLLDLSMPDVSGWEVLEVLQQDPQRPLKVVVLSDLADFAAPIPGVRWTRKVASANHVLAIVRMALQD